MADENFFGSPKAAAVFKHAVLDQYLTPFTMKVGSTSESNRVAFVDGYAGPGMYDDQTPGSPARAIAVARELAARRRLECHFVEKKDLYLDRLRQYVESEQCPVKPQVYDGDVAQHLAALIDATHQIPTFVFLDPFGLVIPFDSVVAILDRPAGPGSPGVEVLINFSTRALRRFAGMLESETPVERTIERLNEVCGGDWWQDLWRAHMPDKEAAEEAVAVEYARRLAESGGFGSWVVDVRNRPHHMPAYYLVFLSRHRDGLELFGESVSLGTAGWRRAIFDEDFQNTLFDDEDSFKASEKDLATAWSQEIERNLRRLLAEGSGFNVASKYAEVFGSALGKARNMHLRVAWRTLFKEGVTSTNPTGVKWLTSTYIAPGPAAT